MGISYGRWRSNRLSSGGVPAVRTVCSYCGVGCGLVLDIGRGPDGRRTVLKASGDKEHPPTPAGSAPRGRRRPARGATHGS
ncbi:hypothetical protein [Streptomyces sp. NPDC093990]|uniref:hypothetical protein n=1 Tax=Streptomyces sp. NPDC093990 TaxID=3155306 RepID=UPI003444D623